MLNPDSQRIAQGAELADLLAGDVVSACAGLVGCVIARRLSDGSLLQVQLVELEAYHQREPGCHAHRGQTPRTAVMFGPPGRLYVYLTYGMWHCANIVCEAEGTAAAVLLRAAALYPTLSREEPGSLQDSPSAGLRLHGPGLLCQALQLDRSHSGTRLSLADPSEGATSGRGRPSPDETFLYRPAGLAAPPLSWSTRVGFSFQDTYSWRCYWTGHPAVGKVSLKPLRRSRQQGSVDQPG